MERSRRVSKKPNKDVPQTLTTAPRSRRRSSRASSTDGGGAGDPAAAAAPAAAALAAAAATPGAGAEAAGPPAVSPSMAAMLEAATAAKPAAAAKAAKAKPAKKKASKSRKASNSSASASAAAAATTLMRNPRAVTALMGTAVNFKTCNCKNSRCLKLYCDCFASGGLCGPKCNCTDCHNGDASNALRRAAVNAVLERNANAFLPKIITDAGSTEHMKGCHCRKSRCLKKYCECFQAGIVCSDHCKCQDCSNFTGSEDLAKALSGVPVSPIQKRERPVSTTSSAGAHAPGFKRSSLSTRSERHTRDTTGQILSSPRQAAQATSPAHHQRAVPSRGAPAITPAVALSAVAVAAPALADTAAVLAHQAYLPASSSSSSSSSSSYYVQHQFPRSPGGSLMVAPALPSSPQRGRGPAGGLGAGPQSLSPAPAPAGLSFDPGYAQLGLAGPAPPNAPPSLFSQCLTNPAIRDLALTLLQVARREEARDESDKNERDAVDLLFLASPMSAKKQQDEGGAGAKRRRPDGVADDQPPTSRRKLMPGSGEAAAAAAAAAAAGDASAGPPRFGQFAPIQPAVVARGAGASSPTGAPTPPGQARVNTPHTASLLCPEDGKALDGVISPVRSVDDDDKPVPLDQRQEQAILGEFSLYLKNVIHTAQRSGVV